MPTRSPSVEFYEAADGRNLAVRVWQTAAAPAARVVLLHGITSHGGWYSRCAEHLAEAGLEIHFVDRRGSGLNAERPGDVEHWTTWLDDVAAYLRAIRDVHTSNEDSRTPVVLCGISWGGKLAAALGRRYTSLIDALALVCPGLYSPFLPGRVKRLVLAAPAPPRLMTRRLAIPLRRPELFTDSLDWRRFIADDPLTLRSVTWRFAREDRRLTLYAQQAAPYLHMPLLLVLAGRDRIVNNSRTRTFFTHASSAQKALIEYPSAAHTLEFEPDPTPYFNDLAKWLTHTAMRVRS